jgi:DNA-binding NarL/FixJ family response regulator
MGEYRTAAAGEPRLREAATRRSAPSLDNPRFDALLLRLHASIDIRQFWSALLSILDEFLPRGTDKLAFVQRLHPHLETALQRLSAYEAAMKHEIVGALSDELTAAESELVQFVRIGFSNKEIAARLDKSVRTVKTQLTSVYRKCGVRSRSRLLAMMMPRLSYD